MTDEEAYKRKLSLLENQAKFLIRNFDTVQIFTTKYDGQSTQHFIFGSGNWCARYGQIRQWINEVEGEAHEYGARRISE